MRTSMIMRETLPWCEFPKISPSVHIPPIVNKEMKNDRLNRLEFMIDFNDLIST